MTVTPVVASDEWSLVFDGAIELCDEGGNIARAAGKDYWYETLAEGADFGDPQPIEVAIASLMQDGSLVSSTGDQNREAKFLVTVKSTNPAALEDGVANLHRSTNKRTTLLGTPPRGYGSPRVWEVETSNLLAGGFDDFAFGEDGEITYTLRLVCQPYRRGTTLIVDDAGTPPSSGDVVYVADDDTGWSKWRTWPGLGGGLVGTSIDVDTTIFPAGSSASIRCRSESSGYSSDTYGTAYTSSDQVTGLAIDTGTGGYLSIPIRTVYSDNPENDGLRQLWVTTVEGGEVEITDFLAISRGVNGFIRYVWPVDGDLTVTGWRTTVHQTDLTFVGSAIPYVWYGDVELAEAATTDHQIVKQHFVQGSARTTGAIQISSPTESVALGRVLAITAPTSMVPDGYSPDCWRWITQGGDTTDTTALHGVYYTPNSDYDDTGTYPVFAPPAAMFTAGRYTAVALVKVEGLPLVSGVRAQLMYDGTLVGPEQIAEVSIPGDLDTGWQFVPLGTLYLPPRPVQNPDLTTRVQLTFKGAKIADLFLIPAWRVDGRKVADFTIVDCGDDAPEPGGSSSSLWIDAPSIQQPEGAYWRGPTPDRMNAHSAWDDAHKKGTHPFPPGWLTHWCVATNAAGPTSTLRYYDRYL